MVIITKFLEFRTKGENDIKNITEDVRNALNETNLENGMILVFAVGATGAITTIEYENGLLNDFISALTRIAPKDIEYEHGKRWNDDNGRSHVKSSLLKPDLTVPFKARNLILGTWQQIVFVELDTRPRERKIVVQIMGE